MTNPATPPAAPTPPGTPPPGGMPKWLIIVIVLVLVMMLGCCGGFAACRWMCTRAGTTLQTIAQEQLKKQGADFDTTGNGLTLPDNFPTGVPVYSGFKAVSKVAPPGQSEGTVIFKGSAAANTVGSYYESEMGKAGWTQSQSSADQGIIIQTYTNDTTSVSINVTGDGGQTMLQITYATKK